MSPDCVSESVIFTAEGNELKVSAVGDLSKADIAIPSDDDTKIIADDKVKSKFSIEYLKKMIQGSKLSDKVILQFGEDYPLKLEYKVLNKVQLAFILGKYMMDRHIIMRDLAILSYIPWMLLEIL